MSLQQLRSTKPKQTVLSAPYWLIAPAGNICMIGLCWDKLDQDQCTEILTLTCAGTWGYYTKADDSWREATLAGKPSRAHWWMSLFFIGSSELCWLQWTLRTIQAVNSSQLCFTPWFHTKQRSECLIFYFKKFLRAYGRRMLQKKKNHCGKGYA